MLILLNLISSNINNQMGKIITQNDLKPHIRETLTEMIRENNEYIRGNDKGDD